MPNNTCIGKWKQVVTYHILQDINDMIFKFFDNKIIFDSSWGL